MGMGMGHFRFFLPHYWHLADVHTVTVCPWRISLWLLCKCLSCQMVTPWHLLHKIHHLSGTDPAKDRWQVLPYNYRLSTSFFPQYFIVVASHSLGHVRHSLITDFYCLFIEQLTRLLNRLSRGKVLSRRLRNAIPIFVQFMQLNNSSLHYLR